MAFRPHLIICALLLVVPAGCGGQSPRSSIDAKEPAPAAGTTKELKIRMRDGKPVGDPQTLKAIVNDQIRITIVSDGPISAHLHGYDVLEAGDEGQDAVFDFMATIPGVVELEDEASGKLLANLAVYPK